MWVYIPALIALFTYPRQMEEGKNGLPAQTEMPNFTSVDKNGSYREGYNQSHLLFDNWITKSSDFFLRLFSLLMSFDGYAKCCTIPLVSFMKTCNILLWRCCPKPWSDNCLFFLIRKLKSFDNTKWCTMHKWHHSFGRKIEIIQLRKKWDHFCTIPSGSWCVCWLLLF